MNARTRRSGRARRRYVEANARQVGVGSSVVIGQRLQQIGVPEPDGDAFPSISSMISSGSGVSGITPPALEENRQDVHAEPTRPEERRDGRW